MSRFFKRFGRSKDSQDSPQGCSGHPAEGTGFNLEYGDIKQVDEITRIFQSLARSISPEQQCSYDNLSRYTLISLALFDAVSTGIMLIEMDGTAVLVNRSAKGWLGFAPEDDLRGLRIDDILENCPEFIDLISRCLRTGESLSRREIRYLTRDGNTVTLGATLSPVRSDKGEVQAVVVVFARIPESQQGDEAAPAFTNLGIEDKTVWHLDKLEKRISDLWRQPIKEGRDSDLIDLLTQTRWLKDCLISFQLRQRYSNGPGEYVDFNSLVIDLVDSLGLKGDPRLRVNLQGGLPLAQINRRIVEKGLGYLVLGSLAACRDGAALETYFDPDTHRVSVDLSELGTSAELVGIHCNLGEYMDHMGCYRELGLMLLRSDNRHTVCINRQNGFYCFSLSILVPKKTKARQKGAV